MIIILMFKSYLKVDSKIGQTRICNPNLKVLLLKYNLILELITIFLQVYSLEKLYKDLPARQQKLEPAVAI